MRATADAGKLGIGVDSNQNGLHPGKVLTSMVKRVDVATYNVFDQAKKNTFKAESRTSASRKTASPGRWIQGVQGGRWGHSVPGGGGRARWPRAVSLEARYADALPELVLGIGPERLLAFAIKAMTPRVAPTVSIAHIHEVRISVREHAFCYGRGCSGRASPRSGC